jgi:hypothetical protein
MELTVEIDEGQQTSTDVSGEPDDKCEKRPNYFGEKASADPKNRDVVTGDFLPGHKLAGPGRPKGSLDYMSICRTMAKRAGLKLEDLVWAATRGLAGRAAKGDSAAAKILLDRLCGPVDKALVEIDARSVGLSAGPPIPQGGDFSDWVKGLNKVAAQQGLLGKTTPTEIVEQALAEVQAVDELLG